MSSQESREITKADLMALIENTDDFILFSDAEAKPVVFNSNYARAMKQLLGIDMKPGLQPHTLIDDESRASWDAMHRRVLGGEKFKENYSYQHQGQTLHFEVSFNPVYDGDKVVGFCEYTRDITEQKMREEQLRKDRVQSEENYQLLFEKMMDGFAVHEIILDDQGRPVDYRFLNVNPGFEALTGLSAKNIIGRTVREVMPDIEEHWIETYGKIALGGEATRFENYSQPLDRHYEVHAFRPQAGQFACVFQDVTARKRLEDEQRKTERLESVGILAGGIAHDFNNLLASITASIQLARWKLDPQSESARMLAESEQACVRASALTRQLLTFARGGHPVKKTVHLSNKLPDWVEFALHGSKASARFDIAEDLWPVSADTGQLSQCLHNLVINADQAMPTGGTISVKAENVVIDPKDKDQSPSISPGDYVKIEIADQGIGIAKKILPKIFDPYFTTKQAGSGLGLATCYSIIRNHGGHLQAHSVLGEGSRFQILLPATEDVASKKDPITQAIVYGSGRVLLMDDDQQIQTVAGELIRALGYQVDVAADGQGAIEMYQAASKNGKPYAVLVLDLTIRGGMGGAETIKQLLAIDPKVRAIVSSGYSNDPVMANYRDHGFAGVVSKPYGITELANALSQVIKPSQ